MTHLSSRILLHGLSEVDVNLCLLNQFTTFHAARERHLMLMKRVKIRLVAVLRCLSLRLDPLRLRKLGRQMNLLLS